MEYSYQATVEADPDGGFVVTFEDVPEAITAGNTYGEALANAKEALDLALQGILEDGHDLPPALARNGVSVPVDTATILAFLGRAGGSSSRV